MLFFLGFFFSFNLGRGCQGVGWGRGRPGRVQVQGWGVSKLRFSAEIGKVGGMTFFKNDSGHVCLLAKCAFRLRGEASGLSEVSLAL